MSGIGLRFPEMDDTPDYPPSTPREIMMRSIDRAICGRMPKESFIDEHILRDLVRRAILFFDEDVDLTAEQALDKLIESLIEAADFSIPWLTAQVGKAAREVFR
jgi:hypothetical protein